jgi:hypothetical protein
MIVTVPKQVRKLRERVRTWFSRYQTEFASDSGSLQTDSGEGAARKAELARLSAIAAGYTSRGQKSKPSFVDVCSWLAHMGSPVSGSGTDTGTPTA